MIDRDLRERARDAATQADDPHAHLRLGLALFRTGQACAAIAGRAFVLPDDVKRMALPVLAHRLILRPESRLRKVTPATILNEILTEVAVPTVAKAHADDADDPWR